MTLRSLRSLACIALLAPVLSLVLIGCTGSPSPPEIDSGPFSGPPITVNSKNTEHVLVAQLPNPGYSFTLDLTRDGFNRRSVFVTFRRPNPTVLYPQMVVEQRLATGVNSQIPITVYARLVDFDDRSRRVPHSMAVETPEHSEAGH
jgi:hypothetical protein